MNGTYTDFALTNVGKEFYYRLKPGLPYLTDPAKCIGVGNGTYWLRVEGSHPFQVYFQDVSTHDPSRPLFDFRSFL
jgi:hypothetical protein